ncbi:MAG: hypothetical protein JKY67_06940 [Pseudomonadales bacterium]|nr:hypothetical protein [Pseudomonadales bacterium]
MFNLKQFISDCQDAVQQPEPQLLIKELVQEAISDPAALREAFSPTDKAKSLRDAVAFKSEFLTILDVVTPPGMRTPAHDHQMWAVIGVYEGEEPNEFFVVDENGLKKKSDKVLKEGDVAVLNGKTIHAISNTLGKKCYAIHVYGGDIVNQSGRSMWNPKTLAREPYDIDKLGVYIKEMRVRPSSDSTV